MNIKLTNAILKIASSSTPNADAAYTKIAAKLSNAASYKSAIMTLFADLGIENSDGIWSKIKMLNIFCAATSADGDNAFYDVISEAVITPSDSYTITDGRGMSPATYGGKMTTQHTLDVNYNNAGIFCICTQVEGQTLGSGAGKGFAVGNANVSSKELVVAWLKTGASILLNATTAVKTSAISDYASSPETFVLSCKDSSDTRTLVTNEGSGNATFSSYPDDTIYFKYATAETYCSMPIVGITDGLTAEEAVTLDTALKNFITNAGIVSAN